MTTLQFYIDRADKVIHKPAWQINLKILVNGRAFLGEFGGLKYYAFRCPEHGLQHDYSQGYKDYHRCQLAGCNYQVVFGGCPF